MATATPLVHPLRQSQLWREFPHRVTFHEMDGDGSGAYSPVTELTGLPCNYRAAQGGEPGTFEAQAPALDQITLQAWQPAVAPEMRADLTLSDGTVLYFTVDDTAPTDDSLSGTVVTVGPVRLG